VATAISYSSLSTTRASARRRATVDEALTHATDIATADGAGAVSVSEVARRMGMKAPSLYKYFPSLHALLDALFERGNRDINSYVDDAVATVEPGVERLRAASHAVLRWSHENRGLAMLMFWRPIPGFAPSAQSYEPSEALWQRFRADLRRAARRGQLRRAADSDDVMRMLTALIAGVTSQQLANEPGETPDAGGFLRLADPLLDIFFSYYAPRPRRT
jgi:AcrR family transcriptional regulator